MFDNPKTVTLELQKKKYTRPDKQVSSRRRKKWVCVETKQKHFTMLFETWDPKDVFGKTFIHEREELK